jgi:hypothetical protein
MKSMTQQDITPEIAEHFLAMNRNRRLRNDHVKKLANDMRNGYWSECIDPIYFLTDGSLVEGQHRLRAVIASGTTQRFYVAHDVTPEQMFNDKSALPRSIGGKSILAGKPVILTSKRQAVARAVEFGDTSNGTSALSPSVIMEIVMKHIQAIEWVLERFPKKGGLNHATATGAVARAFYIESDHARLAKFCEVLTTGFGNGAEDSAAIAMRNFYLRHGSFVSTRDMWRDTFLQSQNAIEYFMNRRPLTIIRKQSSEAYPLRSGISNAVPT